jgi:hypothetical protein
VAVSLLSSAPDVAHALDLGGLSAALRGDSANADGFRVIAERDLYRTQARPWMQIPTGAKLLVRAPAGVTEADVHRAARAAQGERSPMGVQGAELSVIRSGDLYELHITAKSRSQALEIQRRAKAL